jgi:predicted deacetylase
MGRVLGQPGAQGTAAERSRVRRRHPARIAVAVHDVEPATFERCALIRDWLGDHGVDRATLLVIPARDLHPLAERSPQMAAWLNERASRGDAIAQHGFHHQRARPSGFSARVALRPERARCAEFLDLDQSEAKRAVDAGWRVLKLAGVEPDGFVAPAYAYTNSLRQALSVRFSWWAGLLRVHRTQPRLEGLAADAAAPSNAMRTSDSDPAVGPLAPAWSFAAAGPLTRTLSPTIVRASALLPMSTLRIDLHPADLRHPRHMLALEWVLAHSGPRRTAVTYRELAGAAPVATSRVRAAAQPSRAVNIDGSNDLTAESPA